ncbi:MBL fold metallo-hydrolase [Hyphomicrobium sp.]|jgi:ribonuclease BN (tRNA processing enzyme)|uniref:MBL fold metallo-hydrolase n=1 Tax=Hyphomicrobium sp. TaxID=82 RepID=UPI003566AF00
MASFLTIRTSIVAATWAFSFALSPGSAEALCPGSAAVQVLGSGGPDANDARASAGYVLWMDGKARLLVDAGGGIFLRFGEAKAKFETLDAIAITHLHADHVADLIALLKSGFFSDRREALPLIGPSGGNAFPGISEYMQDLLDPRHGAYRYLSGYLDGSGGLVKLAMTEVPLSSSPAAKVVFANARFKVMSVGVTHGPVPALAYVVEAGGRRIAFSGDQNGDNPAFASLIDGVDILIMDHAIPEMTGDVEAYLHARPSEIGKLAGRARVGKVVLSHNMARSLTHLGEDLALIRQNYKGPVVVANDLMCFAF